MDRKKTLIWLSVLVIGFMVLSLSTQFLVLSKYNRQMTIVDARVSSTVGIMTFCINHPPVLDVPCNLTLIQNEPYYCQLSANDSDPNSSFAYSMSFSSKNGTFNMTSSGTMNFTPNNSDVGTYVVTFSVDDLTGCSNGMSNYSTTFTVVNVNDPPYLVMTIPNQQIVVNTSLSAFMLDDFFDDIDGDNLSYARTQTDKINVQIAPSSAVSFSASTCGINETVVFTAFDPYNLSASSNEVRISVQCDDPNGGGQDSGKGGGGGGGGAMNLCRSEWICDPWMQCLPTGKQWQRCYDMKGCEPEKHFIKNCTYDNSVPLCVENWLCEPWGKCWLNGTQFRSCKDLNVCSTNVTKPSLVQGCAYQPSCNDGIQNGNETDVDCGGDLCPACAVIQNPAQIDDDAALSLWLILMIALSILLVSGIVRYYKAEIEQMIAAIGFMLAHRTYKDVLLDSLQRNAMFEKIRGLEQLLASDAGAKLEPAKVYSSISVLMRQYFSDALGLSAEMNKEELLQRCKQMGLRPETTMLLSNSYSKLEIMEQEELELDMFFVAATLEELRTLVCLTSDYEQPELQRVVEEIQITDKMSFYDEIFARSINALRSLQYGDVEESKKWYLGLLTKYEALSEQEKEAIYPELTWLFETIKFSSEMSGSKIAKKPAVSIEA